MTQEEELELSLSKKTTNRKQKLFVRYVIAILIDLTVLSLFNEFLPQYLYIATFSLSLFTALILQILLQLTLKAEHKVADYFFKGKSGVMTSVLRGLTAWSMIFVSKLIMLKAISIAFGESVHFGGALHGVIAFIIIITTMIVSEQIVIKIFHALADKETK